MLRGTLDGEHVAVDPSCLRALARARAKPVTAVERAPNAADNRIGAASLGSDLDTALARLGYPSFRPGQRDAIATLLEKRRLLLVAPTGGGKSLTYQLPAAILPGTTLVVSPLIALMNDQVSALEARGVPATYLAATLDASELRRRMAAVGRGTYKLVYVAPERLAYSGFLGMLASLDCPLVAIDEAHCISEWGHDFRPEYLEIGRVLERLAGARVMACTATATPVVRDEILARLGLGADTPQIVRGFARPNLVLCAREAENAAARHRAVDAQLVEALERGGERKGAAIVYAPTRAAAEAEAARLRASGWTADAYHAGREARERERVQRRFMSGELSVVAATNAFGMGIDRADVRAVIHLAPPGSIEAYYQEVGRAGRDGDRAYGLLLHASRDLALRRRLIEMPVEGRAPDASVIEHKWNLFLELVRWIDGGACRHDAILRYFGTDDAELEGCGHCDMCESVEAAALDQEAITIVRKALSGVARVHGRFGFNAAVLLLRGVSDDRLERAGLSRVTTFGALADEPEPFVVRLIRRCIGAGWVAFTASERPLLLLTAEGRDVMIGRKPVRLALPPRIAPQPSRGPRAPKKLQRGADDLDASGRRLFDALRAHRLERARADGVPPYVVASDRTLREIASLKPKSSAELMAIHGIGAHKAERFGTGLLAVVARHADVESG